MYGGWKRRMERTKHDWYCSKGQDPPNLGFTQPIKKKKLIDTQTYTNTTVLDVFAPVTANANESLSYWEGDGAGIEPIEFRQSISSLRQSQVMSKCEIPKPKPGRLNNCFTPYENDVMTFDAFETARKELKRRSDHLATEMKRVQEEWTRPPVDDWFCIKNHKFTKEHCRFMELKRRDDAKRTPRRPKSDLSQTYSVRRSIY